MDYAASSHYLLSGFKERKKSVRHSVVKLTAIAGLQQQTPKIRLRSIKQIKSQSFANTEQSENYPMKLGWRDNSPLFTSAFALSFELYFFRQGTEILPLFPLRQKVIAVRSVRKKKKHNLWIYMNLRGFYQSSFSLSPRPLSIVLPSCPGDWRSYMQSLISRFS